MVRALSMLPPQVTVDAVSSLYESPPQPPAPPPTYYNAAVRVSTSLRPGPLLRYLKDIEQRLGREARERWAPRPIDLDIALYDGLVMDTEALTIPHPRIVERAFVLRPLLDLDPELRHPVTGERLETVLAAVGDGGLVKVARPGWERRA
jgi:2-amino-4-hydroxy-6-hydroxymethyldihydropteridine diphosphokinase